MTFRGRAVPVTSDVGYHGGDYRVIFGREEMEQVANEATLTFSNCFIGSLTQDGLVTVQH